jgi:hypothetical protein
VAGRGRTVRTAVQLRTGGAVQCEVGAGEPAAVVTGRLGPVALFGPDEVVAYLVRSGPARSLFVFRTLAVDDRWAASVPGVHPRVRLLVHVRSALRVRAMGRLFAHLARRSLRPSQLSDAFYVRVSHAVGGRTDQARLRALVRRELANQAEGPTNVTTERRS